MGKAQDDEARPVAAQAPRRGAPPRAPSPGPIGRALPVAARGQVPVECPDPPRPRDAAAALRAPSPLDAPCTRDRRVGPPAGTRVRRARQARTAGPPRAAKGPRRLAHGRPLREPLAPPGRARLRPLVPIVVDTVGVRASNGPISAAGGCPERPTRSRRARTSLAVGACAGRSRLSPATVCAVPWCWAECCWSSCCSSWPSLSATSGSATPSAARTRSAPPPRCTPSTPRRESVIPRPCRARCRGPSPSVSAPGRPSPSPWSTVARRPA